METASIIASFVSVIISVLAIWQAIYFYTQGKNTERNVQVALEAIKTQTDALQTLNARTLDRLTKYVTTPRDESTQTAQLFAATMRDIPDIVLRLLPPPRVVVKIHVTNSFISTSLFGTTQQPPTSGQALVCRQLKPSTRTSITTAWSKIW
jgi:hypothetical protein